MSGWRMASLILASGYRTARPFLTRQHIAADFCRPFLSILRTAFGHLVLDGRHVNEIQRSKCKTDGSASSGSGIRGECTETRAWLKHDENLHCWDDGGQTRLVLLIRQKRRRLRSAALPLHSPPCRL